MNQILISNQFEKMSVEKASLSLAIIQINDLWVSRLTQYGQSGFHMTVEVNHAIAIATLRLVIGLKVSRQFFQPTRSKTETNRTLSGRF